MLNGKPYCRRCISFRGEEVEHKPSYPKKAPIHLEYELSSEQKELSDKLVENYKKGIDSLVFAVCGSGKTEISLGVIQYAIKCGEKVAFALPRRDVAIELHKRLKEIFTFNKVVCVYGGHTQQKIGDIVVLTTHQLYRYKKYFSLIILDEIDAFPFKDDPVLYSMFEQSLSGHYIMMSATPSDEVVEHFSNEGKDILNLQTRFHRHPLPIPKIIVGNEIKIFLVLIRYIRRFIKEDKPIFIFAPTIRDCESLYLYISIFIKGGNYVHSKRENRKEIIDAFRGGIYKFLVTTSVLERGVTVCDLQVIVYKFHEFVYDKGTLIQIAGRVGRKADAPEGEVIFIGKKKTKDAELAIESIEANNRALSDMLQRDP
jgi:competence protein ComFA